MNHDDYQWVDAYRNKRLTHKQARRDVSRQVHSGATIKSGCILVPAVVALAVVVFLSMFAPMLVGR